VPNPLEHFPNKKRHLAIRLTTLRSSLSLCPKSAQFEDPDLREPHPEELRMPEDTQQFTQLLLEWSGGKKEVLDQLMPVIYDELRKLAGRYLYSERRDHTLRATALVNEAYLRLVSSEVNYQDRMHFFAVAARTLRHILVDYAKARKRDKRGGGVENIPIDEAILVGPESDRGIVELDDALNALAAQDPDKAKVVELVFFGGLTYEEAADVLKISRASVYREMKMAKAWLHRELTRSVS
jgi:RNA polymerase sigma factor (TIGR02999 family)